MESITAICRINFWNFWVKEYEYLDGYNYIVNCSSPAMEKINYFPKSGQPI